MPIDMYVVNKEIAYEGKIANVALQIRATGIPAQEARNVDKNFEIFVASLNGTAPIHQLSGAPTLLQPIIRWTEEEYAPLKAAESTQDAWDAYHAKFPNSHRKKSSIMRMWTALQDKAKLSSIKTAAAILPAAKKTSLKKGAPGAASLAKNFDAAQWSEKERDSVRISNTRAEAVSNYREKFPDSKRSDDAIGRQFYEMHPDKRSLDVPWTTEEKQPLLTADTIDQAIEEYQKLFPKSTRSIPAIRREWYELRPEKRGDIPTGRKKGIPKKTPLKGTAREKYQIPFSTTQDAKAYNHGVYICKKYDKPYAEALKLEEAADLAKKGPQQKPVPEKKRTATMQPQPAPAKVPSTKKVLLSSGVMSPDPKKPEPPAAPQFTKDMKVRYTGIRPLFAGTGTVKRVNPQTGEVLVDINNGLEWMHGKDLAPVTA